MHLSVRLAEGLRSAVAAHLSVRGGSAVAAYLQTGIEGEVDTPQIRAAATAEGVGYRVT